MNMERLLWTNVTSMEQLLASAGGAVRYLVEGMGKARSEAMQLVCDRLAPVVGRIAQVIPSITAAWAECGFQVVEPAHKLAASLAASTMPAECVASLELPWRAFLVRIPAGALTEHAMQCLVVKGKLDSHISVLTCLGDAYLYGYEHSLEGWNLKLDSTVHPEFRVQELVGRLVIGICAEMMQHRPSIATSSSAVHMKRGHRKLNTFKLTRPVTLDVRAAVRAYARGTGSRPTVQTLVRGHWKLQPWGACGEQRKLIHVEPYWRGPEEAPIAVRPHLVGDK